ncbi:MAG: pantoate--beta-alanine ligase [Caldilineales bacterium]|nr:pantoate--beta-alanine ligase [Caldilineales bacterium]
MKTIHTVADMQGLRRELSGNIGLVPTMGFLHKGHISLAKRARAENDLVIATIFVNPTQFGPNEDLAAYPRDLPRDLSLLENAGVDFVFVPTPDELYPPGFQTWVELDDLPQRLEGAHRPGHFRGVATIVTKLFNLTRPTRAYFGQKDAQQAVVIRRFTRDLNFDIDIVICPTVREPDGLAMSSRNIYLNPKERQAATVLFRALSTAQAAFSDGERDADRLRTMMQGILATEPLARPDYVSLADAETLAELSGQIEGRALASMAVRVGPARLIDNMILN